MCIYIDSRCVILNIIQAQESFDLSILDAFATALKKKVHNAYIDISDESVFTAIDNNRGVFHLEGTTIKRSEAFGRFADRKFLDSTINRNFPDNVRTSLRECAAAAF